MKYVVGEDRGCENRAKVTGRAAGGEGGRGLGGGLGGGGLGGGLGGGGEGGGGLGGT